MKNKIPVTLLVGFLGSGKTTLLNNILKGEHQLKIAIIENEFASINIDQEFINKEKTIDNFIIEMNNGCLCCSMNGDLITTLQNLLSSVSEFDHIVIEATGMASPGPIIQMFSKVQELIDSYSLKSVVTVVDSKNFFENLENTKNDEEFKFEEQLIYSDYILLNKVDLIEEGLVDYKMDQIKAFVKNCNSSALMVPTKYCDISIKELLARDAQNIINVEDLVASKSHQHGKGQIEQISIENVGDYDPEFFQLFLNSLYMSYRNRLFRIKGVLSFPNNPNRILLQGVNDQLHFEEGRPKDRDHSNKFILVGIGLKKDVITKSISNCLIKD